MFDDKGRKVTVCFIWLPAAITSKRVSLCGKKSVG